MISYKVEDQLYALSMLDLQEHRMKFLGMGDVEFCAHFLEIAHFACIVCWIKETARDFTIGDRGIIHQLIHAELSLRGQCGECSPSVAELREQLRTTTDLGMDPISSPFSPLPSVPAPAAPPPEPPKRAAKKVRRG